MTETSTTPRWLRLAIVLYLSLAVVAVARAVIGGGPTEYAGGFHAWEGADVRRFRWTRGERAYLRVALDAPVLQIPFFSLAAALPPEGTEVRVLVGGRLLASTRLRRPGWRSLNAYVPVVSGVPAIGEPVWLEVRVDRTFVPARVTDSRDRRRLGVAVGDVVTLPRVPRYGIGIYPPEQADRELRWTTASGTIQWSELSGGDAAAALRVRAAYPASVGDPVTAVFFVDHERAALMTLSDERWHAVELEPPPSAESVLSVRVTPTFDEGDPGVDGRTLGVALAVR